jgi:hypothetical protein
LILITLQLGVPVLMLLRLAMAASASRLGLVLHVGAVAAWLLAIRLSGMWTVLPWWTPHALAVGLVAISMWRLTTGRRLPALPARAGAWAGVIVSILVASIALLQVAAAIRGRSELPGPAADITLPLSPGTYLVVNGGSDPDINAHLKTLAPDQPAFRAWRAQSYGVDLIRIDAAGLRARGFLPEDPTAYVGFGTRVIAPCNGSILQAVDGLEDNRVPQVDREHRAGNHLIVRCEGFDVLLAHLRQGSVAVKSGDRVAVGDVVGELGNSGNSDEPHLHVHAQRDTPPGAPFSGEPVPLRIDGRNLVRNQRLVVPESQSTRRSR